MQGLIEIKECSDLTMTHFVGIKISEVNDFNVLLKYPNEMRRGTI